MPQLAATNHSPTVAEFATHYLERYAGPPFHSEKHRTEVAARLRLYVLPSLGHVPLVEVGPAHLTALQAELFGRRLSFYSVQGAIFTAFGGLWKAARTEGLVAGRPHAGLLWPKREPNPDPYSAEDRDKILGYFSTAGIDYYPLVAFVLLAGMRPSEAAGLRWGDVVLPTGQVTIERAIASRQITQGKTRNSRRVIVVGDRLRQILKGSCPSWAQASELITTSRGGRPIDSQQWGAWHMRRCCEAVGIRYRGFYACRATYISLALTSGAPIAAVAKFCGTSVGTIERHYWRWVGELRDPTEGNPMNKLPNRQPGRVATRREHFARTIADGGGVRLDASRVAASCRASERSSTREAATR